MDKNVNKVLAIVLILVVLVIGGVTTALHLREFGYAALVSYTQYLDPEGGLFDNISARIQSLTGAINTKLLGKEALQKVNAKMQLALGKQVLSFGGTTMVQLKTGQLYDLTSDANVKPNIEKMAHMKAFLDEREIPMLFVYAHSELYEEGMLPDGVTDSNAKVADDIVGGLRAAGIETLDSREIYRDAGLTLEEAVYRTDQHWSIRTAFEAYSRAARKLSEMGPLKLDERATDIQNFDQEILPAAHMGDVGARVGESVVKPDDFQLITPNFETKIHQKISTSGGWAEREGTFEEAVMNLDVLEGDAAHNCYDTYGRHTELTYYTNEDAPEGRLLIIKDSFGTPVSSFMSLAAREVCALDLRKGRTTAEQMIEQFKPDMVLVVHCQEMMRGKNYVFVD